MRQRAAAAARSRSGGREAIQCPEKAPVIDAGMHEEALVFCGDECVDDVLRHVLILNKYAPPLSNLFYKVSVAAEYAQWDLQRDVADCLRSGQARRDKIIGADDTRDARDGSDDGERGDDDQRAPEPSMRLFNGLLPRLSHTCSTHA